MEITVNKAKLLEVLQENRATHVETFQRAIEKYRVKALEFFEEQIAIIKAGGEPERGMRLPLPEEHTDDFDRAIKMVDWHQGSTMNLTDDQFEQFVENRWGWHRTFIANTTSYVQT